MQKILKSLFNQYLDKDNKNILNPQKEYLENPSTFNSFMNGIKLENDQLELSVSDFFKQLYDEYKISLLSNGGWQSVPLSLAYSEKYKVDNYKDLLDEKIKGSEPFTIYYIIKKDTLQLYVRGTKIELKYHPKFITIIDKLNSHETFSVKELLDDISKEWPLEAGLYSLSLIYDKRGVQIV
jgi:hypothetical protein